MRVVTRRFRVRSRSARIEIVPIGDIHLGSIACDEERLRAVIDYVRQTDDCYWIGMGDYCDFINRSDPRFDPQILARWITIEDLSDLAGAQVRQFRKLFSSIARKCLCLVEGNHEEKITKVYERPIFYELVSAIRQDGGFDEETPLGIGYTGWLRLRFKRPNGGTKTIDISLHHGAGGGQLAGGKVNRLQRWLWTHDCDLALFGHCHNLDTTPVAVERLDENGNLVTKVRKGAYCGTFLKTTNPQGPVTYSERKQYLPMPTGNPHIVIQPFSLDPNRVVRITY